MFKKMSWGNLYIHGAYWHNKFGQPVSGGCVNVPYSVMEELYNWTDVGTKVTID
jgi:lipoprotein-anchoring transpeptidase ErfK/SrfK